MFQNKRGQIAIARLEAQAVKEIEFAHCAIHDDTFSISNDYVTEHTTTSTLEYVIEAPEKMELHVDFDISVSKRCKYEIYKNAEFSGGDDVTQFRPHLGSEKDIKTTKKNPTITDDGTLVKTGMVGAATGGTGNQQGISGSTRNGQEIIIPPEKNLLIKIIALAADTDVEFNAEYYEVEVG